MSSTSHIGIDEYLECAKDPSANRIDATELLLLLLLLTQRISKFSLRLRCANYEHTRV